MRKSEEYIVVVTEIKNKTQERISGTTYRIKAARWRTVAYNAVNWYEHEGRIAKGTSLSLYIRKVKE